MPNKDIEDQHYQEILNQGIRVRKARREFEEKKEIASEARKEFDRESCLLEELINQGPDHQMRFEFEDIDGDGDVTEEEGDD